MSFGDSFVTKYKRDSLRILGTVGEPINPEAWRWYRNVSTISTPVLTAMGLSVRVLHCMYGFVSFLLASEYSYALASCSSNCLFAFDDCMSNLEK